MNEHSKALPKKKWKVRYSVLFVLWLCWLFSFLDRMVITIALPFIGDDLNLNATAQGLLLSIFFAGYALFQIPGGMLSDKFGFRRVVSIAIIWWSIFTTLTGFIFSYPLLLLLRFVFGLGEAALPGGSYKAIATYFPSKQRGTATGIQSTVNTLGPAIAAVVAAAIIGLYGWRVVFIVMGLPGLAIGVYIWLKFKDNPKDHPKITKEELAELDEDAEGNLSEKKKSDESFKELLKKPILWQMALIWFFFDITFWGFTSWLPSYLIKEKGLSLMSTGIYSALPYLVGTIAIVLGGYLSDKVKGNRKWVFIPSSLAGGVALFFMFQTSSLTMVIIFQCFAAFFMFLAQGAFWGLVVVSLPAKIMASGSATVNCFGSIAGFISPFLMGYMIQTSGSFDTSFIMMIVALVVAAVIALTINEKPKEHSEHVRLGNPEKAVAP
ncbi:MFS transporter [Sporosarcina sp. JAI121]|uniref:MFS transporter n=1 Tax=Sporosarcina sp. JAI121 TaxID=2723064 RepID=UPI0015C81E97|nr:MFS transporter [Sporosarcina sp. JAI121]NYF24849.1 sugar phosphate permease [Sporosarcina sp. JAI121]